MANLEDSILTPAEKAQITAQREKQWGAELFGHRLNRGAEIAAGGEAAPDTDAAIATLETALTTLAEQKQQIDAEVVAAKAEPEAIK